MTVIRFLSDFAELFLARSLLAGFESTVLYNQTVVTEDGKDIGTISTATITKPDGGALEISVGFPLDAELKDAYTPELTDEQWELYLQQVPA